MKICGKCGGEFSREEFSRKKDAKDGLSPHCKTCAAAYQRQHRERFPNRGREYRAAHREGVAARNLRYRERNREALAIKRRQRTTENWEAVQTRARDYYQRNRDKLRAYSQEYARIHNTSEVHRARNLRRFYGLSIADWEAKFAGQQGLCGICQKPLQTGRETHVDHDHVTALVRDLLCRHCNSVLGLADEDPVILRRAAEYLESWRKVHAGVAA